MGRARLCIRAVCPHRALSPAPRPSSRPKLPVGPCSSLSSSPQPLGTSDPQSCSSASAPLPQVNGGFRAPPHQLPEASKPPRSLCKKRKRNRRGETQGRGSETCALAAAPPGKRRKKKGKRAEAVDASPLQEGQVQRQHRGLERRKEGRAEVPVDRLEEEGGRQQENGQQAGCHVSGRKRRREGAEGLGAEDGLPQDPPWHR